MAKEKAPAFQFYPKDFLSDGRPAAMTPEQVGVYVRLLCFCWLDESVPDDPARCARMTGVSPARMGKLWPAVRACFVPTDGVLRHSRLDAEREKQQAFAAKQAENGRRGGRPSQKPSSNPSQSQPITDREAKKSSAVSDLRSPEERTQGRQAVPLPAEPARPPAGLDTPTPERHGGHVRHFCAWVCLPEVFIEERLPQLGGASAEDFLEWAAATERAFAGHPVDRSKPFDFWRARLAEATASVQATPAEAQQYQNYLRAVCNAPGTPMTLANFLLRLRLGGAASGPVAPAFAPFVGISRKDQPA